MAKTKVKVEIPVLEKLLDGIDKRAAREIGSKVVKAMKKQFIAKGISPVAGIARFPAYAAQRKASPPLRYPDSVQGDFPGKRRRPINLFLSGDFLKKLNWWHDKNVIGIGMSQSQGKFSMPDKLIVDMFETHNDGTQDGKKNQVPQRKFLPNKKGDEFKPKLQAMINDGIEKFVNKIIKSD